MKMRNHAFKNIIHRYRLMISENCGGVAGEINGLDYWQDRLFTVILSSILPLSLLAIVPGVIMSVVNGLISLAIFDSLILFSFMFIAFKKNLSVFSRKLIFILLFYSIAAVLLYFLGSFGPGLLYLLAATVFTTLIFNRKAAYLSVIANCVICTVFGFAVYFKCISGPLITEYTLGAWIAVSSNLLILSFVITALLPTILKRLQTTIEEQQALKISLKKEQHALEKALHDVHRKNQDLEEFAYMTSHDLQEPLRMVASFLGLLEKNSKTVLDEKSMEYLHFAVDGAERMQTMISDMLDYSLEETKQKNPETVDLNKILDQYVVDHTDTIKNKKAAIHWSSLPLIHADKLSVQRLFQNLLSNSLKYQQKNIAPKISIDCSETTYNWEFKVSDNGIGMPAGELDKIFGVFKRLHDRSEFSGTRIGLAICKKIIENHHGNIWAESQPDQGSSFYFTIPKREETKK